MFRRHGGPKLKNDAVNRCTSWHKPNSISDTMINVDNLSVENDWVLTSPRSLEACRASGIKPEELILRTAESFVEEGITPSVAAARFDAHQRYRAELARLVSEVLHSPGTRGSFSCQRLRVRSDFAPRAKTQRQTRCLECY